MINVEPDYLSKNLVPHHVLKSYKMPELSSSLEKMRTFHKKTCL